MDHIKRTYKNQFPDFSLTDNGKPLIIPELFVDNSWHNDTCPNFLDYENHISLWIDYEKPEDRETFNDGLKRFALLLYPNNDFMNEIKYFESENFEEILSTYNQWVEERQQDKE